MPETTLEPVHRSEPPDKPAYHPYPEVARAIRSQSARILDEWRGRTLFSMPELAELTVAEFQDDIARILSAMADALESNDPPDLRRLMQAAPAHGFHRFMQDYDLSELFAEERVLRRVIVSRVEEALARRSTAEEAAALHAMIDIMLQQGVLALVQQQRQGLRQGAEAQLKHLSFISHDLGNTFFVMSCNLEWIQHELSKLPEMSEAAKRVGASLAIVKRTRQGMNRLLQHERLRNSDAKFGVASVTLREIVEPIVTMATADMSGSGPRIDVAIDPKATASTNADLLTIILQNLIGNAVKHSSSAATAGSSAVGVRVEAERLNGTEGDSWIVSVIDDGPGIPQDQLDTLFNAFGRLPQPGERAFADEGGFGLGLAIASQAARLLGTTIEVKTQVGQGCRFSLRLPALRS
ncbi:MAG: ATP-binding protein [Phycisphaerae bacterium]|nr:ATP-binding protein [Phycisphaerae bacterium]